MKTTHQFQAEYGRPVKPVVIANYDKDENHISVKIKTDIPNDLKIQTINIQDDNLVLGLESMYLVLTMLPEEDLTNYSKLKFTVVDNGGNVAQLEI